jgi:hypothetical protein
MKEQKAMWIPDKLYELLPFLYGLVGLFTFYKFDTSIGFASGILLLVTACLVWVMRRDYLREIKRSES